MPSSIISPSLSAFPRLPVTAWKVQTIRALAVRFPTLWHNETLLSDTSSVFNIRSQGGLIGSVQKSSSQAVLCWAAPCPMSFLKFRLSFCPVSCIRLYYTQAYKMQWCECDLVFSAVTLMHKIKTLPYQYMTIQYRYCLERMRIIISERRLLLNSINSIICDYFANSFPQSIRRSHLTAVLFSSSPVWQLGCVESWIVLVFLYRAFSVFGRGMTCELSEFFCILLHWGFL